MKKYVYVVMCEWCDITEDTNIYPDRVFIKKEDAETYLKNKEEKIYADWLDEMKEKYPFYENYSKEALTEEMLQTGYWHHYITKVEFKG